MRPPLRAAALLAFSLAACSKDPPPLTPELIAPVAAPLMPGKSEEAEVLAKFSSPEISKDKSLGGDKTVQLNGRAGELIEGGGFGEAWLLPDEKGTLRLSSFTVHSDGVCAWVKEHIAKLPGADNCPGNRKTGDLGKYIYYCLSTGDGQTVGVQCDVNTLLVGGARGDVIQYWILLK